jgi:hypothetical protein
MVSSHAMLCLEVADERLNRRSVPRVAVDCIGHLALLAGGMDLEAMLLRRIVALVAGVAKMHLGETPICVSISGMTAPSVLPS